MTKRRLSCAGFASKTERPYPECLAAESQRLTLEVCRFFLVQS